MKKQIITPSILSLLLVGLLLIPLDGTVNNTFAFFIGRFHPIILHLPIGGLIAKINPRTAEGITVTTETIIILNMLNLN